MEKKKKRTTEANCDDDEDDDDDDDAWFLVWLIDKRYLALFLAETIARDPHHDKSLTSRV